MPNVIDGSGLTVNTLRENIDELSAAFRRIYGDDIVIDSNSPDGQMIGIFSQVATNVLEKLVQINASFDIDQAAGIYLDQRAALIGIRRNGATYTIVPVTLTANKAVSIDGLDDDFYNMGASSYSVQDVTGNVWYLIDSIVLDAGENTVLFRAKNIGEVAVISHAINKQYASPRTEIIGVDNATAASILGQNGETDPQFRTRIRRSQAVRGTAAIDSLTARLLDIDGMQSAMVYENYTGQTDANGLPPHSIWVIVNGGSSRDIGMAIATTKGFGVDQKIAGNYWTYTTPNGIDFRMYFDRAVPEALKISMEIFPFKSGVLFDYGLVKQFIADNLEYAIGQPAEAATITCLTNHAIGEQGGGGYPLNVSISTEAQPGPHTFLVPTDKINVFTISPFDITITTAS